MNRRILVAVATFAAAATVAATASADWTSTASGSTLAHAASLPTPDAPSATGGGESAAVSWQAPSWPGPAPAYKVTRWAGDGTSAAAGGSCAGPVTSTSCTDSGVTPGTYTYTVSVVSDPWSGADSAQSAATQVFAILRSLQYGWTAAFSDTNGVPLYYCGGTGQSACTTSDASKYPVQVRWGSAATSGGPSGLGFNGGGAQTVDSATPFAAGTLTHINFPVYMTTVETTAKLTINVTLKAADGTVLFDQPVPITFGIDETPNSPPCKYPSTSPCADAITIQNVSGLNWTNTVNGTTYRFTILGFRASMADNTNITQLISNENQANQVLLVSQFDVVG